MANRRVKSFEDVNSALRELFQFQDYLRTSNVDFNKRRIINAHPSIDDYDYVVRKELIDTFGEAITPRKISRASRAPTYDKITFGLGVGGSIEVGDNVTLPYIWTNSANGRPEVVAICANIPPTGADLIVDIKQNGTSIFGATKLVMPAGTSSLTVIHTTSILRSSLLFKRYDVFSVSVTQVGSSSPGQEVEIVIFCNLI